MRQGPERAEHAGVADEDVDAAEALVERRAERVDPVELAQIERHERRLGAFGLNRVVEILERADGAGDGDDVRAFAGKAACHGGADAARCAGDESETGSERFGHA